MSMLETGVSSYYSIVVSRIISIIKLFFSVKDQLWMRIWKHKYQIFKAQENWKIFFDHSE